MTQTLGPDTAPDVGTDLIPTWTSSAKDLVTTALGAGRLWATLGYGILNEVYWPSTGEPQIRDLGFIVAGPDDWFEVKRVARYRITTPQPDIPLPRIVHEGDGYRLTIDIVPDPLRDVLLVDYALEGEGCKLYVLLAPRLGQQGSANIALAGAALWAKGGGACLCLASEPGFSRSSAGRVGSTDGWQDFNRHGAMTHGFGRAGPGNVALTGEMAANQGTLALAFSASQEGATTLARSALAAGFTTVRDAALQGWRDWARNLTLSPDARLSNDLVAQARCSAAVIRVHEDRTFPGAVVASLSVPWGNVHNDMGGYHLVWARDAVNSGLGLLSIGQTEDARRMLSYLVAMQQPDGHWGQNFYPDGRPFWKGVQMDEVALPVILATKMREMGLLDFDGSTYRGILRMVEHATGFILRNGPITAQDRWEENAGLNGYTLAVLVAALVAAGEWLDGGARELALATADDWNARIEDWIFVCGAGLDREHGVEGHYVRISPRGDVPPQGQRVRVQNRGGLEVAAEGLVAMDFLALARFGLRTADDPAMRDTMTICEAVLGINTPSGRTYHRYNDDGYGEDARGAPFDGHGIGRGWPLLTGERGHFALQAGEDAVPYLEAMAQMTGPGGMIPEQVWDSKALPGTSLCPGKPSGSAMPLVWAHSEFLKLSVAIAKGRPVELLACVEARYGTTKPMPKVVHWRTELPIARLALGTRLRIVDTVPFTLHCSHDSWRTVGDIEAMQMPFGLWGVIPEIPPDATEFVFTRRRGASWEGEDHSISIG